jgi:hypothetical protein
MKKVKFIFVLVALLGMNFSCKKDQPDPVDEPTVEEEGELITTFKLSFVDSSGLESPLEFVFRDTDGPGGNSPSQFDTIRLSENKTYFANISVLNESVNPAINLTQEIKNEGNDHLFCFTHSLSGLDLFITDSDGTYGIGLESTWKTATLADGMMNIKLKHQPGIKNGNCEVGETDIDLNFKVIIQ